MRRAETGAPTDCEEGGAAATGVRGAALGTSLPSRQALPASPLPEASPARHRRASWRLLNSLLPSGAEGAVVHILELREAHTVPSTSPCGLQGRSGGGTCCAGRGAGGRGAQARAVAERVPEGGSGSGGGSPHEGTRWASGGSEARRWAPGALSPLGLACTIKWAARSHLRPSRPQ